MVIYRSLSAGAEQSFASTWGVSQALDQAQQWKDVMTEAVKASVIIVVLDILRISSNIQWFECVPCRVGVARLLTLLSLQGLCRLPLRAGVSLRRGDADLVGAGAQHQCPAIRCAN